MAHQIYDEFLNQLFTGDIDLDATNEIKVILCSDLPATGVNDYTDIRTELLNTTPTLPTVAGTEEYIPTGLPLQNVTVVTEAGTAKFNADDITWNTTQTIQAVCAVLYHNNSSNGIYTKPLMMCFDFGVTKTAIAEDFTIEWNNITDSIFEISS